MTPIYQHIVSVYSYQRGIWCHTRITYILRILRESVPSIPGWILCLTLKGKEVVNKSRSNRTGQNVELSEKLKQLLTEEHYVALTTKPIHPLWVQCLLFLSIWDLDTGPKPKNAHNISLKSVTLFSLQSLQVLASLWYWVAGFRDSSSSRHDFLSFPFSPLGCSWDLVACSVGFVFLILMKLTSSFI